VPQFRFRVLSPDGRVRSGRYTANSLDEARQQIETSGLTVVELTPLEAPVAGSVRKRARWESVSGYWLAATLACWGLSWGFVRWLHPANPRPRPAKDAVAVAEERFQASFRGTFAEAGGARLIYRFPEVPYQVERKWNSGEEKIEFLAARKPSYCLVELRNASGLLATARIEPLQSNNEFSLTGCPPKR